ncbi:MAG TPA: serine hydrolase domain-containing protein [Thermoanaerobaculia bacterium]|nr:serine hydrolase domain-containing protein [Thermoanaerobaculia bacterium]
MSALAPLAASQEHRVAAGPSARNVARELLAADRLPGLTLAVSVGSDLVCSEALGWASLDPPRPATTESRLRIASISKALTSVALGLLWQEGSLDLDAEVQRYVPSFPRKQHAITVRQLAGHLSGLPHYAANDMLNREPYSSVTAALSKFAGRPLVHAPGERFAYSSFGWNLLAAVIEGVAGIEYLRFMADRVFAPLGMADTAPDLPGLAGNERADCYVVRTLGDVVDAPAIDNSDAWASAGFLSTAEDLVRFARGVLDGGLLEPPTVELLFTPMRTRDGAAVPYGLGWELGSHCGRRVVGHGGSHVGATAQLLVLPEERIAVALLANANSRSLRAAAARVARLVLSGM